MGYRFPLLLMLCCLLGTPAYSATYYIDAATGRDTAAGTSPATAWRTINRVNALVLQPGDTVLLRRGGMWREKMYADDSGTATLPITFGAYSTGPDPILNGADLVTNWQALGGGLYAATLATVPEQVFVNGVAGTHQSSLAGLLRLGDWFWEAGLLTLISSAAPANVEATVRQYLIDSGQVDHVAVRDIAFEKATDPVRLFGASNVTLERLSFTNCVGYAAILLSAIGGNRGQNNTIRECRIAGMRGSSQSIAHANNGAGIFVWGLSTCRNNRIEGCTITDNGNAGILLIDTASNVVTENVISGNGSGGIVVSGLDSDGNTIQYNEVTANCQSENDCFGINFYRSGSNNNVRYNTVYSQHVFTDEEVGIPGFTERSGGIRFDGDLNIGVTTETGNAVYGNLIHDEYEGIQIFNYSNVTAYNNTIFNVTRSGMYIGSWGRLNTAEGNRAYSNIIHTAGQQFVWNRNASTTLLDNNVYYPNGSGKFEWNGQRSNFNGWKTNSGQDGNSSAADPQFVSAGAGNFQLAAGSPAIDRGATTPAAPVDLVGLSRPQGAAVDAGAYEYAVYPVADFTATPRFGGEPLLVQFTDTSTAGTSPITAWSWDFDGDGAKDSAAQHPTFTYTASGEYTVRLRITTALGQSEVSLPNFINVTSGPNAAFSATPTAGIAPLNVTFTDQSSPGSAPITGWAWDFDNDGATDSTQQHPTHVFAVGTHSVLLTVTDSDGQQNSRLAPALIVANTLPEAAFSADSTSGLVPLGVQFTDHSVPGSQPITTWSWDFGDGDSSTLRNPAHTYASAGTFTVSLTVITAAGSHTQTVTNLISTQAVVSPAAAFSGTPLNGIAPLQVAFQDLSTPGTYPISAWHWTFGDGGSSSAQNPTHSYGNSGTYAVSLEVTTAAGTNLHTKSAYVTVAAPIGPAADFDVSPGAGLAPLIVQFTDTSEPGAAPIDTWHWDFGDGSESSEQHPVHEYHTPGTYAVSLEATTAIGSDLRTRPDAVQVYGIIHVNVANSTGVADGVTWNTAFPTIQDGIDAASAIGGGEVWVAAGTYSEGRTDSEGALRLLPGVQVFGGFEGTENQRDERNWNAHQAIISGTTARSGSPAYHVVRGADDAVLDGFLISGGRADSGSNNRDRGAGIYNDGGSPRIANCTFRGNFANRGGAAYNSAGAEPEFLNCIFSANEAQPSFLSEGFGGAVYNDNSAPKFTNCVFHLNVARAALFADGLGGAVYSLGGAPEFMNCTLVSNRTYGAIFSNGNGGAMYNNNAAPVVTNCILWDNLPNQIRSLNGSLSVTWSIVQSGQTGTGNLNTNPLFTDAAAADFTLGQGSPAIDAGTALGAPATDLRGISRPQGANIDMGAHESFSAPAAAFTATLLAGRAPLNVTFTDQSTPGSATNLEWEWDFGDGTGSSEQAPVHEYTQPGTYTVRLVLNPGAAEAISDPVVITVLPGLAFTAHPGGQYAYEGEEVTFAVEVNAPDECTFQWWYAAGSQKVAINPGGDSPQLALGSVVIAQAGEYWCEVSNGQSDLVSDHALLQVAPPLAIVEELLGGAVPEKKPWTFRVAATGGFPPLQYFWYKDGQPLAAEYDHLLLPGVGPDDAGTYQVQILDNYTASAQSASATLTVLDALPLFSGWGIALTSALVAAAGASRIARRKA